MPVAALNVRPSRQRTLHTVRVDNRNREVALRSIGEKVILYAPADEPRRGYFGTAAIADVNPDIKHRRFIFITLRQFEFFGQFFSLESLIKPIESRAYDAHGAIDFSYFLLGIRTLTADDQIAASLVAEQARSGEEQSLSAQGLAMPPNPLFTAYPLMPQRPARLSREVSVRDRRLRWSVLEAYGAACAVCGDDDAAHETGSYEVEVCHLHGLRWGGPDILTNAMPMCRKHHWAYDEGLFALGDAGGIIPSRFMEPKLRRRFNGWTRAHFPKAIEAWPKAEFLQFHRSNVFLA
jgi:predicted restriction endonuclease